MAGVFPNQPTKGTKRSFSGDDDSPVSPQQRPSRRSSQAVPISKKGDPPRVISNLFCGTIEFWLLILYQESWPFLFNPAPPKTTESENGPGQNPTATGLCEMEPCSNHAKEPSVSGTIGSPVGLELSDARDEQDCWDEAVVQLVQQRHQLCLWKVGLSDRDLDGLLENELDIYRELGKTILEALLGLAVPLSTAVDLHKTSERMAIMNDMPALQASAHRLKKFIEDARKITDDNYDEYDPKPDGTTESVTTTQLLAQLQSDITMLDNLDLQIRLATASKEWVNGDLIRIHAS